MTIDWKRLLKLAGGCASNPMIPALCNRQLLGISNVLTAIVHSERTDVVVRWSVAARRRPEVLDLLFELLASIGWPVSPVLLKISKTTR